MNKYIKLAVTTLIGLTMLAGCNSADLPSVTFDDIAVREVELNSSALTLEIGETYQLVATIKYREGKEESSVYVEWNSSNPSVATVSETGLVTAKSSGYATISYLAGFKMATCSIYVPSEGEITPTTSSSTSAPVPTSDPTSDPTSGGPTTEPTSAPTSGPTTEPTSGPTTEPSSGPTSEPTSSTSEEEEEDDEKHCTVYFFIDYNNIDENDTTGTKLLAIFNWYGDRPLSESGLVPANPTTPMDPAFPYFIGWSSHTVIDSKDDLWDMANDTLGNGYYFFLYGIWSDVSAGEFVK